jgi:integrase/recombinase XerD
VTVGLYVQVAINGKRRYCRPVVTANKKLRPGYALVRGQPQAFDDAVFVLRYQDGKKRRWEVVGPDPAQAVTAKLRREHLLKGREIGQPVPYDTGIHVAAGNASKTSLKKVVRDYLNGLARNSKQSTIRAYSTALTFFLAEVGDINVEDLSRAHIERYIEAIYRSGLSSRTISNRIGYVHTFLISRKMGDLIVLRDKPKYTTKAPDSYNKAFLTRLFAACDSEERAAFKFFLRTGCREQEVMYACWSDLDLVRGTLTIREKPDLGWTLKDYEERVIPLTSAYVTELRARRKMMPDARFLFPTKNGKPDGHWLRKLKKIALRAGLNCGYCTNKKRESCRTKPVCEHVDLHHFRRTFASIAHHEGKASVQTIKRWLGHSDIATTMLYLASSDDNVPQVREHLEEAFSFAS